MNLQTRATRPMTFPQYVRLLRRWWIVVILFPVIGGTEAYWFTSRQPKSYTASATLLVRQVSPSSNDVTAAKYLAVTYSQLVLSPPVLERAYNQLRLSRPKDELADQISVSNPRDTQIVKISTEDTDPTTAANISNAVANEFTKWVAEQQSSTDEDVEAMKSQVVAAEANVQSIASNLAEATGKNSADTSKNPQAAVLEAQLRQAQSRLGSLLDLQQQSSSPSQSRVLVVAPAEPPQEANRSHAIRDALLAFVLGLAVACLGIVLFERTQSWLRSPIDVTQVVDVPVIGILPSLRRRPDLEYFAAPQSIKSEAIRSMCIGVELSVKSSLPATILVSSATTSRGKSLTAANLAAGLAIAGYRVLLVDGDLRRPQQHKFFGQDQHPGFSLLLNRPNRSVDQIMKATTNDRLHLISAGFASPDLNDLLNVLHVKDVLMELQQHAEIVVIDAPPVAVPDTIVLATLVDHVVLVVDAGETRAEELRVAQAQLYQAGVLLAGIVLHGIRLPWRARNYTPVAINGTASHTRTQEHHSPRLEQR